VRSGAESLDLADSLTGDAHKLLNVPYDCGFFFSRNADMNQAVFQNPNAAYLKSSAGPDSIVSPLNIRIENSSRFRGLPVYATLSAYGILGYRDMLERQVRLARAVAFYIQSHEEYELLPPCDDRQASIDLIFIIVLFRARKSELNVELVRRINSTSKIYVSGTMWDGRPASRIAISNWQVDVDRDLNIITAVLESVL
jgi:glutamate/tyrosine decarboxylase-like PLP-dependent enzyme